MQSARWFLSVVLAVTALGPLPASSQGAAASTGQALELSFSLEKRAITLHEPVLVRLRAENKSDRSEQLDMGFDRVGNLRFTITRPGERPVEAAPLIHEGIARPGLVKIDPGQTYAQDILLSALFGFSEVGLYVIQADLTPQGAAAQASQPPPYKSQKMHLRVLPRDVSQLKRVCTGLVDRIMSSDAESSIESAAALSYVNDLVAVPFLEQAATSGPFNPVVRPTAIDGLARISLSSGKAAVLSQLKQKNPRIESEITAHMAMIAKRRDLSTD